MQSAADMANGEFFELIPCQTPHKYAYVLGDMMHGGASIARSVSSQEHAQEGPVASSGRSAHSAHLWHRLGGSWLGSLCCQAIFPTHHVQRSLEPCSAPLRRACGYWHQLGGPAGSQRAAAWRFRVARSPPPRGPQSPLLQPSCSPLRHPQQLAPSTLAQPLRTATTMGRRCRRGCAGPRRPTPSCASCLSRRRMSSKDSENTPEH